MKTRVGSASWLVLPAVLLLGSAGWLALRPAAAHAAETPAPSDSSGSGGSPEAPAPTVVTKGEIAVALLRAGLSAEALACAGANANAVAALIDDAQLHMNMHAAALAAADTAYASARVERDQLERKVQSGAASKQEVAALAAAKSAFTQAESMRGAEIEALFQTATAHLSVQQRATLAAIRTNQGWDLPVEYLAGEHAQIDWVKLRDALANKKISAKYGDTPDAAAKSVLASVEASPATAGAKANKESLLSATQATWNTALTE
jgi:hypothetical protein